MLGGKSALGSLTINSALVVLAAQVLQLLFGYTISADDQAQLLEIINQSVTAATTIATIAGALGAIVGRVRASKPVTHALPKRSGTTAAMLLVAGFGAALSACSAGQNAPISPELERACQVAMLMAPQAGDLQPWIVGACSTAPALAKLAQDPGSLAWVLDLVSQVEKMREFGAPR